MDFGVSVRCDQAKRTVQVKKLGLQLETRVFVYLYGGSMTASYFVFTTFLADQSE